MFAWTIWCSCVILCVSLQRGQAERIWGNELNDDYDVDLGGLGTDVWTERNSTTLETELPTDNNRTPPRTDIYTSNNTTPSGADVWTNNNSTRSTTVIWTDVNSNGSGMVIPTENNVTQPETDATTALNTVSSKTAASIDERSTGINTQLPEITPPDVCQNSSCQDILSLTTTVPEGKNLTLRCGSQSSTETLWWYRDTTFLQRDVGEVVLHIADVEQSHSGHYLCIDERGCCILEHHVSVYSVPQYAYHLAVMGAVLAVGIPFCVFLSVRRSSRLGRYARMFNERHGEETQLIW